MRQRIGLVLALATAAALAAIMESGAADVFLEATRPDFQKIPVGVLGFRDQKMADSPGMRLTEVLKADLRRSQIFAVADPARLGLTLDGLNGAQNVLFKQAADNGIAVLVWGQVAAREPDLVLDGLIYDGVKQEAVASRRTSEG